MSLEPDLKVYGIVGCSFSGTTLLSLLLGAHSRVFSTGEAHQAFQAYRCLVPDPNGYRHCAMHHVSCKFWTESFLEECDKGDLDLLYNRVREEHAGTDVVLHCFGTPKVYTEMLQRSNRLDGLIILFKRPVAYYSSAKTHLDRSLEDACNDYVHRYTQTLEICSELHIPSFTLFYDDMATKLTSRLESLCDWMGLDYEPTMRIPWAVADQFHSVGGNTGVYTHMWDDSTRNWVLRSDYWKETYSPDHSEWVEKNYQTVTLDEKWRSLPSVEVDQVNDHIPSQDLFKWLLQLRTP